MALPDTHHNTRAGNDPAAPRPIRSLREATEKMEMPLLMAMFQSFRFWRRNPRVQPTGRRIITAR